MNIRNCRNQDIAEIKKLFRQFVKFHSDRDSCFIRGVERVELFAALTNERSTAFWRKMGLHPFMEQMYISL